MVFARLRPTVGPPAMLIGALTRGDDLGSEADRHRLLAPCASAEAPPAPDADWPFARHKRSIREPRQNSDACSVGPGACCRAAALALAALAASFLIGVKICTPQPPGRQCVQCPCGARAAAVAAPHDHHSRSRLSRTRSIFTAPSRFPASRRPGGGRASSTACPISPGVSTGPVLTAASIGTDVSFPVLHRAGTRLLFRSGRQGVR